MSTFSNLLIRLLCIVVIVFKVNNEKLVALDCYSVHDYFKLKIRVGNEDIGFTICQENDVNWIRNFIYQSDKVKLIENITIGQVYDDTFILSDGKLTIDNVRYVSTNNELELHTFFTTAGLGLPYKFSNNDKSFIHNLYSKGYIDHLSYSVIHSSLNNRTIVFGGIAHKNMKSGICHVKQDQSKWSCELKKVIVGGYTYENSYSLFFQMGAEYIYAPMDFINFISNVALKEQMDSKSCRKTIGNLISCDNDIIDSLPNITIVLDEAYSYTFIAKELFEMALVKSILAIHANPYSNNTWMLGSFFIKHFDTLFDYENSLITIYSNDKISNLHAIPKANSRLSHWYSCLIIVLFLGIALLSYTSHKFKYK